MAGGAGRAFAQAIIWYCLKGALSLFTFTSGKFWWTIQDLPSQTLINHTFILSLQSAKSPTAQTIDVHNFLAPPPLLSLLDLQDKKYALDRSQLLPCSSAGLSWRGRYFQMPSLFHKKLKHCLNQSREFGWIIQLPFHIDLASIRQNLSYNKLRDSSCLTKLVWHSFQEPAHSFRPF